MRCVLTSKPRTAAALARTAAGVTATFGPAAGVAGPAASAFVGLAVTTALGLAVGVARVVMGVGDGLAVAGSVVGVAGVSVVVQEMSSKTPTIKPTAGRMCLKRAPPFLHGARECGRLSAMLTRAGLRRNTHTG